MGVVLILDEELHWGLDQTRDLDEIWSVVSEVEHIHDASVVCAGLWYISLPWGATYGVIFRNVVFLNRLFIGRSVDVETLVNFSLDNSDRWLLNCQVSHLDVQTVEVNSINTLSNITGKLWFAHFVEALDIWDGASLMELSEEVVEVNDGSSVDHPLMPVGTLAHGFTLEILNDLLEVPWER